MTRNLQIACAWVLALGSLLPFPGPAAEVKVAVAANFTAAMKEIAAGFEQATGHTALLSFGSTGKLYAQIIQGAPFALFLAADQKRPKLLEDDGRASRRFTYATGKLVLWSAKPDFVDARGDVLTRGDFRHLAIVNPQTAPYGAAAMQVLDNLGLSAALGPRLVRGENVTQTYQFVATGNAELGFVALSQVMLKPEGSRWKVPQSLYTPIRQDAVLLERGADQPAALALLAYLKGPEARAVIERLGYAAD